MNKATPRETHDAAFSQPFFCWEIFAERAFKKTLPKFHPFYDVFIQKMDEIATIFVSLVSSGQQMKNLRK